MAVGLPWDGISKLWIDIKLVSMMFMWTEMIELEVEIVQGQLVMTKSRLKTVRV